MIVQLLKKKARALLCSDPRDYVHAEISCDVEKCTSLYGFGFSSDRWHYLASTMRQYLENPNIAYKDTCLWTYFQKFQPANMFECLFGLDHIDSETNAALSFYRDPERGPMPWTTTKALDTKAHLAAFTGDYGPLEDAAIAERFERIKGVVESLKLRGYRHDMLGDPDDPIRGVIIKHGNDWRMVIIGGNHRASALAALGYSSIPVQSHRGLPAIIDVANSSQWPIVRGGVLSDNLAKRLALFYFSSADSSRVRQLELPH